MLLREEFAEVQELRLPPEVTDQFRRSRDHFADAPDMLDQLSDADRYPCSTQEAAHEMRTRGLDIRPNQLALAVSRGLVTASREGRNFRWTPEDIDAGLELLEESHGYIPYVTMCICLGCRYVDY